MAYLAARKMDSKWYCKCTWEGNWPAKIRVAVLLIGLLFPNDFFGQNLVVRHQTVSDTPAANREGVWVRPKFESLEEWLEYLKWRFKLQGLVKAETTKVGFVAMFWDGGDRFTILDYPKGLSGDVSNERERAGRKVEFWDELSGKEISGDRILMVDQVFEILERGNVRYENNVITGSNTGNMIYTHGWVFKLEVPGRSVRVGFSGLGIGREDAWLVGGVKDPILEGGVEGVGNFWWLGILCLMGLFLCLRLVQKLGVR